MSLEIACHTSNFGTAGQITPDDIQEIVAQGYQSIINNRPDSEGGPSQPLNSEIEAAAIKAGLKYEYLPVISGQMTREQVEKMAQLLETLPKPILAFCRSGARSSNLFIFTQQLS